MMLFGKNLIMTNVRIEGKLYQISAKLNRTNQETLERFEQAMDQLSHFHLLERDQTNHPIYSEKALADAVVIALDDMIEDNLVETAYFKAS